MIVKSRIKSVCALALLLPLSALAESMGNPGFMSADTPGIEAGKPKADFSNAQDKLFVRQATLGGRAEVDLGKLAQSRGRSQQVKQFGEHMAADHSKANDKLLRIGKSANAELPKGLAPDDAAFRSELEGAEGTAFDQRYLVKQIADHQKTVNLLLWEISNGQNQELRSYAGEMLPNVLDHLRQAQMHLAELTGSAPPR
jgi:putative membrane protein